MTILTTNMCSHLNANNMTVAMLYYPIFINILTFVVYGIDKWKAKQGSWRIPEATLLGMAIIGFIFNFILGTGFTYFYNYKHEKLVAEQNKRILEFQSKKTAKVTCAYCHHENLVPIDLSNTKFRCPRCKHVNRLIAEFNAAQITVPQSTDDMIGRAVENEEL